MARASDLSWFDVSGVCTPRWLRALVELASTEEDLHKGLGIEAYVLSEPESFFCVTKRGLILTKRRVDRTLDLTFIDTPGEAVAYDELVGVEVWRAT
ncbi:hypothetical protein B296_00044973 [Ensete ventricosum]|uniref:Uncharacterized protein n=1 Tax=Ensete ventricosum TaxID=4639 RepID=A0A426X3E5_ENSVE|nr:hypothetical protein B296_00044973 [Ensete ventricosum]